MPKEQDISLRQEWQEFKKRYPDFEKSKNFKSDVGPQLDKRDKAFDAVIKTRNELEEVAKELKQINKNLDAALGGYGVIVKELAKDPKKHRKGLQAF
jgi:hypothetical protein